MVLSRFEGSSLDSGGCDPLFYRIVRHCCLTEEGHLQLIFFLSWLLLGSILFLKVILQLVVYFGLLISFSNFSQKTFTNLDGHEQLIERELGKSVKEYGVDSQGIAETPSGPLFIRRLAMFNHRSVVAFLAD
jgi:hypothetical protein